MKPGYIICAILFASVAISSPNQSERVLVEGTNAYELGLPLFDGESLAGRYRTDKQSYFLDSEFQLLEWADRYLVKAIAIYASDTERRYWDLESTVRENRPGTFRGLGKLSRNFGSRICTYPTEITLIVSKGQIFVEETTPSTLPVELTASGECGIEGNEQNFVHPYPYDRLK